MGTIDVEVWELSMATCAGVEFPQVGFFVPAAPRVEAAANADQPQLLAMLDGLNARFGRGTVRLGSPVSTIPIGWAGALAGAG